MTTPRLRTAGWLLFFLAALAAPGIGAPGGSEGTAALVLTAKAPTFETVDGGGLTPVVEGFGQSSRPEEPTLPLRLLLVAIPEGSVPELQILSADPVVLSGLDLA